MLFQIYMEAKRFGKVYNIRCVCCYGGGSKWEQSKALEGDSKIYCSIISEMGICSLCILNGKQFKKLPKMMY